MVSDRTRAAWLQGCADVAQLVEHHLAKVRVAGSNPVVRSEPRALVERPAPACGGVAERRGNGLQSRLHGFKSRLHLEHPAVPSSTARAIGAVWLARFPDTEEVTGSSPVSPTRKSAGQTGCALPRRSRPRSTGCLRALSVRSGDIRGPRSTGHDSARPRFSSG